MPSRRKTTKKAASRRSSIKVEIDHSVPEQERRRKLDVFIADFENQREARLRTMRDDGDNLVRKISNLFHQELLKIPTSIRSMNFVQFRDKCNSDINTALQMSVLEASQAEFDKLKKPASVRKGAKGRRAKKNTTTFETIEEDDIVKTVQRGKTPAMAAPTDTMKMTRTSSRTTKAPVWADTPLVTPAFNPRLMRTQRKATERCTFVLSNVDSPKIEIPVNGQNVILNKDSDLSLESREVLENISKMISTMLKEK